MVLRKYCSGFYWEKKCYPKFRVQIHLCIVGTNTTWVKSLTKAKVNRRLNSWAWRENKSSEISSEQSLVLYSLTSLGWRTNPGP